MRHPLLASFAVGIPAALLVGIAVTEVASHWIFFSLFVGIPAGILAGIIAIAATYAVLTRQGLSPTETSD
ncbi:MULTISPECIES: hypothetical protein [Haloferax]|uniref:DUF8147 domain-containing protein n=2 Tax=Haloferax TaxID=2251 RepID=A0A6G1Z398_9EURY|nr:MULTISPECIES: hypothetical protein [Haloferax]KAB1188321.1 hypothetical protein Hfx1149_09895 [Haloferax sp. CBA1149]MRW81010.1 hypothetical protein [Haloferax marinisediminis]